MYHITVSGWIFVPEDGVLNEIINSGKLSIIQNDKIKNEIASSSVNFSHSRGG